MLREESTQDTPEEYKNYEIEFHRELMNSCRRYIKKLSIFSIMGILDFVKQEAIELEKATTQNLDDEPPLDIE